jgi:hypothetical protein
VWALKIRLDIGARVPPAKLRSKSGAKMTADWRFSWQIYGCRN